MLTVLVGPDTASRAKRLSGLVEGLRKKGADIQTYTDVNFDPEALRAVAGSTSLFGGETAVVITGICDVTEKRDEFEKIFPVFVESPHQFLVSENSLPAALVKKITAKGGAVEEFDQKAKEKKAPAFNIFLLTDAFSERKRSMAWALYRSALENGLEPREIAGKIFWAVKTMLVAKSAKSVSESGLNPFVYQKAKRAAGSFAEGELERYALELTVLFHEALASGIDLETGLETFMLRALAK